MEPFQSSSTIQNYEFSDDILHLRQRINNKLESLDSISSRVQDSIDNLANEAILIFLLTTSLTVCIPYYLYQLTEIEETDQHIPENERKC
ncbi:uncharacterized protein LOC111617884 isoform X2 [Centruroides sculpturatus]|uniref:uncharacterized protein LOC111617884 isoform X2 n=1 Tax=Centruroides sculpturatus TaxID=218467 RepID=UPI000C6D0D72|nr:uncharacterized protein LOC111617884 isoform X2 [Centruroides sculpturatus]